MNHITIEMNKDVFKKLHSEIALDVIEWIVAHFFEQTYMYVDKPDMMRFSGDTEYDLSSGVYKPNEDFTKLVLV
jgi:hypothetical protein